MTTNKIIEANICMIAVVTMQKAKPQGLLGVVWQHIKCCGNQSARITKLRAQIDKVAGEAFSEDTLIEVISNIRTFRIKGEGRLDRYTIIQFVT